ncbi:MAG: hypothetical protein M3083_18055 [Actinomycetota bacterium]|nr:hypothetical protein [Actinomycetota bacterium]MDQ6947212.1 hypothetical protein [Actinomycetota bacterium]
MKRSAAVIAEPAERQAGRTHREPPRANAAGGLPSHPRLLVDEVATRAASPAAVDERAANTATPTTATGPWRRLTQSDHLTQSDRLALGAVMGAYPDSADTEALRTLAVEAVVAITEHAGRWGQVGAVTALLAVSGLDGNGPAQRRRAAVDVVDAVTSPHGQEAARPGGVGVAAVLALSAHPAAQDVPGRQTPRRTWPVRRLRGGGTRAEGTAMPTGATFDHGQPSGMRP